MGITVVIISPALIATEHRGKVNLKKFWGLLPLDGRLRGRTSYPRVKLNWLRKRWVKGKAGSSKNVLVHSG